MKREDAAIALFFGIMWVALGMFMIGQGPIHGISIGWEFTAGVLMGMFLTAGMTMIIVGFKELI